MFEGHIRAINYCSETGSLFLSAAFDRVLRITIAIRKKNLYITFIFFNHQFCLTLFNPIYVLAYCTCLSFLIPANGGERIGFIITVHLAVVFMLPLIDDLTAPSGDFPRPIIIFLIFYIYA